MNDYFYFGQTICFPSRKSKHFSALRKNKHCNVRLQNSFNKYGEASFIFETVIYCKEKRLNEIEQGLLDIWVGKKECYNISPRASKPPSQKGIKKSKEHKDKISKSLQGNNISKETRRKMSVSHLGKKLSKEMIEIISQRQKIPISQYDKNENWIKDWDSAKDAENFLKIDRSSICKCCKGKLKTCGGFLWKYKESK